MLKIQSEKPGQFSLMQQFKPELSADGTITVRFDGQLQIDLFVEIKKNLINHLKRSLQNVDIDIVTEISDTVTVDTGPKLFTPEDKFRFMVEKNPAIAKLKRDLNLDFG